jgi:hypothetical protein
MPDHLETPPNEPIAGVRDSAPDALRPAPLASTPSPRVAAALAVAMLATGVAVGAAIGPAPSTSLANVSRLPSLLPSLVAAASPASPPPATSAAPPPLAAPAVPAIRSSRSATVTPTPTATTPAAPASPVGEEAAPSPPAGATHQPTLPPVTNVWLVELAGSTFSDALAQPAAAPYISGQALAAGTLLTAWSGLDASAFASDAALLASEPPQVLDTVVEPPCREGAAGVQCAAGTPGALTTADSFLSQTVATLTANPAYRASGLIVVTFGSVLSATATGLPTGASTATLSSQPPAGALLISPFAKAAARPTTAFNPASPKQSLEALLHR